MKTKIVTSAGGVVFRKKNNKGFEVALTGRNQGKIWSLPKGLVEEGETPEKTALREVREETGLVGEIVKEIETIDYWFIVKPEDTRYHKFVHFYLMEFMGGDIKDHDWEIDEVRWFDINEAVNKLTYKSEKQVLEKAHEMLRKFS